MKITLGLLAAAVAVLGVAPSANANLMSVTYQGVIEQGSDIENYFGGGDLTGDNVAVTYIYDPSLGTESTDGATYDEVDGGFGFSVSSPITSANITINGSTYSFAPNYEADTQTGTFLFDVTDDQYDISGSSSSGFNLFGGNTASTIATDFASPATLETPFFSTGSGVGYYDTDYNYLDSGKSDTFIYGINSVTVNAAPEPGTWVLMFLGVGVTGLMLRKRRHLLGGLA